MLSAVRETKGEDEDVTHNFQISFLWEATKENKINLKQ